jgi:arylsulfatase A-like enzyme
MLRRVRPTGTRRPFIGRSHLRHTAATFRPAAIHRTGDRDVPIIVYAPGTVGPGSFDSSVETTQIAPTILDLLGLDPSALDAVRIERTQVLPGIAH